MDLQLDGKVALVTGASRGIGLAIVQALAAEGATVIGAARTGSPELTACAARVVSADLSLAAAPTELVQSVLAEHGGLDILVNNVGGALPGDLREFLDHEDQVWQRYFDLNFFSAVRACTAAVPSLITRNGLVINISSMGARLPHTAPVPYTTAKAALNAYGKALAEEFADQGLRVVTVSPGPTRTPLWTAPDGVGAAVAAAQGTTQDQLVADMAPASNMRMGQLVEPEQVAALVAFLAAPQAAGISGHEYLVDGGAIKTV